MSPTGPGRKRGSNRTGKSAPLRRRSLFTSAHDAGVSELAAEIDCEGLVVPVLVRHHARARRITLRLPPGELRAMVSVPRGTTLLDGLTFAQSRKDWIAKHLKSRGTPVPFRHGQFIPFRGEDHLIVHVPGRGAVWHEEVAGVRRLCVGGNERHLPRRLTDWLKKQARAALLSSCRQYARAMNVRFTRLSVRDQKSRWGSCSSRGALNFSWRVILAPDFVLDYLTAHEVAHLVEMNHSPRFWRLVAQHCPHWQKAEKWLKKHGGALHLIGAEPPEPNAKK